jgi:tRNA 2-thiocytidine biosynthesis protein TtcA
VVPSHLMDRELHPFQSLRATGEASEDGDKAFDDEPVAPRQPAAAPGATAAWLEAGEAAAQDSQGNESPLRQVIPIAVQ